MVSGPDPRHSPLRFISRPHPWAARRPVCATGVAGLGACALVALAMLAVSAVPRRAAAQEDLEPSLNAASIIDFPTALDQSTPNVIQGTTEIFDLTSPDLRLASVHYGRQWNNVQFLGDATWDPKFRTFQEAEARVKVRAINLDPQKTYIGVGVVARWTDQAGKRKSELDDLPYSLLGVITSELYPVENWSPILVNFYVDNRFADAGLKVQLYQGIKAVTEVDYHLAGDSTDVPRWRTKAGLQFDSDKNFYLQLLYDDAGDHLRLQFGAGF
jgi:hypothetical protein